MNTEATESAITITPVEGDELYRRYRGETSQQPVYVSLDCETGELSAAASSIIGSGAPMDVFNGIVRRWRIPALTENAANALLAEIAPLAERVVAGFERVFDGSSHVGKYDDDAIDAIGEILDLCDRDWSDQTIEAWDAADWFGGVGGRDAQRASLGITAEGDADVQLQLTGPSLTEVSYTTAINGAPAIVRSQLSPVVDATPVVAPI